MSSSGIPVATPVGARPLDNLREYGPKHFRKVGAHALAQRLEWLLERHVPDLERRLTASEQQRATFEAEAEGMFAELRLEVRAWQGYAAQLEERRDRLASALDHILLGGPDTRVRWWWLPRRRQRARGLAWAVERATDIADEDEPIAPHVMPEPTP